MTAIEQLMLSNTRSIFDPTCIGTGESVNVFSHLSGHELPEAWRERECRDQQGDEGGVHQAPDRKRGAAGSLMGVLVKVFKHTRFLGTGDGGTINSS